ncbi:hypothetical protein KKB83_02420 [Patescibacteria group bacterium]|nr:hypothetical protein [Patescibacteria group bacterium]
MKLNKLSPFLLGFLQATALLVYVSLVSLIFVYGENWSFMYEQFLAPVFFLLVFIVSAVICATLVLGRAGYLFWEKRYREAFSLLGWTVGFVAMYIGLLVFVVMCY